MFLPLLLAALAGMTHVPAGSYEQLYGKGERVAVRAFSLDRDAVTRGQYQSFVRGHASWQRDAVGRDMADAGYLADWRSPRLAGGALDAPVTGVSWHAARAFCESHGKRLPTVAEWEYAAAASEHVRDASRDPAFRARVLEAYAKRGSGARAGTSTANVYGVRGLHDRVWEWTLDFNPAATAHRHGSAGHEHHAYCASAALGAADPSNYPAFMRYAVRSGLNERSTLSALGFRCAA
ncbi:MAG: formylglycine-generating enzyme family protein [Gemmatimonadaceae bacterium]